MRLSNASNTARRSLRPRPRYAFVAGEEIVHEYTRADNGELLKTYGFVIPGRGSECFCGMEVLIESVNGLKGRFQEEEWDIMDGWDSKCDFLNGWIGLPTEIPISGESDISEEIVTALTILCLEYEAFKSIFIEEEPGILEKDVVLGGGDFLEGLVCAGLLEVWERRRKEYGVEPKEQTSRGDIARVIWREEGGRLEGMRRGVLKVLGREEDDKEEEEEEEEKEKEEETEKGTKRIKLW